MNPRPGACAGTRASARMALVAGLALAPWLLLALLMPGGALGWLGFGLDVAALASLAACRRYEVPLFWSRAVLASLGAIALSALLRFLALPLWPMQAPEEVPTLDAVGESLEQAFGWLAGLTLLHLLATASLTALLLASLGRGARAR